MQAYGVFGVQPLLLFRPLQAPRYPDRTYRHFLHWKGLSEKPVIACTGTLFTETSLLVDHMSFVDLQESPRGIE